MAMAIGESGGSMAEINVTPMIDVLLVLLIIFMVIVPAIPRGLPALVPQPPKSDAHAGSENPIVLAIASHPGASLSYSINNQVVTHADILQKLMEIYANRSDHVLFVAGDDHVQFADVADVIDISRTASVDRVGLITPGSRPAE